MNKNNLMSAVADITGLSESNAMDAIDPVFDDVTAGRRCAPAGLRDLRRCRLGLP